MIALRDLINMYNPSTTSDMEIILKYITQDEVFDGVPELISKACQHKIDEQLRYINRVKMWVPVSNGYYYEKYSNYVASYLDMLTRKMQIEEPFREDDIEFLKRKVPEIKIHSSKNSMFWVDLYNYIHNELNLKFKDEE